MENVYWQSTTDDDLGEPRNDNAFILNQVSWANFIELDTMPEAEVQFSANATRTGEETNSSIKLRNSSDRIAFFLRVEVCKGRDGEEVLPITYEDNYVTLFPKESRTLWARFRTADLGGEKAHLRLEGYNVRRQDGGD